MANPEPSPIVLKNITITAPGQSQVVLANGTGGMVFLDLATITVLFGEISFGGPASGMTYNLTFIEDDQYPVTLPNMKCLPPAPQSPPYIFLQTEMPDKGVKVSGVNAFDNDNTNYVIKGEVGSETPTATLYIGPSVFVLVKAEGSEIKNDGPVLSHNHSVHYLNDGFQQTLSNMMFQGTTTVGLYIFQQIDG